ncbi:ABC transporter permease [Aneurinibacillus aneurinilyticus]|uniref:ABC transporter permease subunit n=1 Tax=Aneurinibacillus aneurinilyticus TaxID=1391 RepID=A0A848CRK4_ANEAE|nr:ABC transporter permease [Aneurinibacillus aneurinilyticus]MCI1696162.1 ABC transporter permease [Aneurinibacillus aneurinilyticus]MED0671687.1 ABC transporter permease [Aneurinibacillus aneurinilyticus]MED0705080.1 ABC transporter permease [Aneurinibacillus aneurinilyticus]MED0724277.1 ABC transporter permease [Aneurinibacillus aneurinilyticus]MED0733085.1 ABC transporter permease [Aneurinibacillus aneurinilyticus]
MLIRTFSSECIKLRHSYIWIVLSVLPIFSVLIGCANYVFNRGILQNEWYSLWTQVGLFYGEFFFPVLIGICCAFLCRFEHINQNWNSILTAPVPIRDVFLAKLMMVGLLSAVTQAFFLSLYFIAGKWVGLISPFPSETLGWIFRGWVASLAIGGVQLWLSMRIRSFAVPVGVSICATLIGLGLYVNHLGMFYPYSLLTIGMGVLSQDSLAMMEHVLFYGMSGLFIILFCISGIRRLKKTDIVA